MSNIKQREVYLDILRILAAFGTICIHVSAQYWYSTDIHSNTWLIYTFYNCITRFAVPVFVMISGGLLLSKNVLTSKYVYKKSLYTFITFISWSMIYSVIYTLENGKSFKDFIDTALIGHYHMWFMYMIIGMYIISPFLKEIIKSEKLTKSYIILFIGIAIVLPFLGNFKSFGIIVKAMNQMNLKFLLGYTGYFILGYYLKTKESENFFLGLNMFLVGFVITIFGTVYISRQNAIYYQGFHDNFALGTFLQSVGIFEVIKYLFKGGIKQHYISNILVKLSNSGLIIYLIHILILDTLKFIKIDVRICNPIFSIPILTILVFSISYVCNLCIQKVRKIALRIIDNK